MSDAERAVISSRKKRGVVRASVTRMRTRLRELEAQKRDPSNSDRAQRLMQKLESLDVEFKQHHYALIDLLDSTEDLEKEQDVLDGHDDEVSNLMIALKRLTISSTDDTRKIIMRKLRHIRKTLTSFETTICDSTTETDICLLHQYEEELQSVKKHLSEIRDTILSLDLEEDDELIETQSSLEKDVFTCSLNIRKLLKSNESDNSASIDNSGSCTGVKLPKLDVPAFSGDILHWQSFWEQFCISVHDRKTLSDQEKLVYLQQSLRDGSAKRAIEGLSHSGECYAEAIKSLKSRYDRPRLIHQAHVRMILDAPSVKDGNGRELRRLHDITQQHLRALKAMGHEPPGAFLTSVIELKLDPKTIFEWQRHSQSMSDIPHYQEILDFIDLRTQASETSDHDKRPSARNSELKRPSNVPNKPVTTFASTCTIPNNGDVNCTLCKTVQHPLYSCTRFKNLSHEDKISVLKANNTCFNCLKPGHFHKQCTSSHRCKKCQRAHHTLLHTETVVNSSLDSSIQVPSHPAMGLSNSLLMTCYVLVHTANGNTVKARALLDSASSASFITEHLARTLHLPRSKHAIKISGIAGLSYNTPTQTLTTFMVSAVHASQRMFNVNALIVPRVTCELPVQNVHHQPAWNHLNGITLADPNYGQPGQIDLLLGIDIFVDVLLQGRRTGPPGTPVAIETEFGWVLAGKAGDCNPSNVVAHFSNVVSCDDLLRRFWELEEHSSEDLVLTTEERVVLNHFKAHHSRTENGRFIVPLPKDSEVKPIGESRSLAVKRFLNLERVLHSKGEFEVVDDVVQEYFQLDHAEAVPVLDLCKEHNQVFYLPIHAVKKESSSTTKIRAVFDASARSSSGVSLNDTLLVGPTVHPPLIDVLLRFRMHRIALTTDVSKMYSAIELVPPDKDLHRFVWRRTPNEPLTDYRMKRLTFGVSSSSFIANMAIKQNAEDFASQYPLASRAVNDSFYVDDGLTGANTREEAIELQHQLQSLFQQGDFLLRKWNSNDPSVLQHLPPELKDSQPLHSIASSDQYTKTLGVEWNPVLDHFRITVSRISAAKDFTKRTLVSDIARTFDVLGWFAPSVIKLKILLQRVWEHKVDWDDTVPTEIIDDWLQWKSEASHLSEKQIDRCYYPVDFHAEKLELHGFCDASEQAYAAVAYLRMLDANGRIHVSLVAAKTKVAPLKRQTIPRLELCGAYLLGHLLHHIRKVLNVSLDDVYAWIVPLLLTGLLVIQGASSPLWVIESLLLSISFLQTAGNMSINATIQLIVPLEASFRLS